MGEFERLNVRVPSDQMTRIRHVLPWGLISSLVRGFLDVFEREFVRLGFSLVGAIIAGEVRFEITGEGVDVSTIETTEKEHDSGPAAE